MSVGEFRPGVRLALDWGKARIGVAACDAEGTLCYPVETIPNTNQAVSRVRQLVAEYDPIEVIIGMPVDLQGRHSVAAETMGRIVDVLRRHLDPVPVVAVDERLTTAQASHLVIDAGVKPSKRRSVIDQQAAVHILQSTLDRQRWNRGGGDPSTTRLVD